MSIDRLSLALIRIQFHDSVCSPGTPKSNSPAGDARGAVSIGVRGFEPPTF